MTRDSVSVPLPRRLIRRILGSHKIGPGSRVLDVGCGRGELVTLLRHLGIEASGADTATGPQRETANPELYFGSLAGAIPYSPHHFDCILLRDLPLYRAQLDDREAMATTANLLSSLKPGAPLVALEPTHPAPDHQPDDTRIGDLVTHFSQFPGSCVHRPYTVGLGWYLSCGFLFDRKSNVPLRIVSMRVPKQAISRLDWHRTARDIVLKQSRPAA